MSKKNNKKIKNNSTNNKKKEEIKFDDLNNTIEIQSVVSEIYSIKSKKNNDLYNENNKKKGNGLILFLLILILLCIGIFVVYKFH